MSMKGVGAVHVRKARGHVVVQFRGQTPRGQAYIKDNVALAATTFAAPELKKEIAVALKEYEAQLALPL